MPRKNKTNKIGPLEEAENAKALDAAAGVASPAPAPAPSAEPDKRYVDTKDGQWGLLSEKLPLTYDTREKLLLKHADKRWTNEFFEDFKDTKELTTLTCRLGVRVLASIICSTDPEFADVKDKIAAMRVILNIEYGENASTNPEKFIAPPPVATIPTGAAEGIEASVAKFRKLGGKG